MNNWMYWMPLVSWANRLCHWIKKDEDTWTEIKRDMMCTTGTLCGAAIIVLILLAITIARL